MAENRNCILRICFNDEGTFPKKKMYKRQNLRYWSVICSHILPEGHTKTPEEMNILARQLTHHIVGSIYLENIRIGDLYLKIL